MNKFDEEKQADIMIGEAVMALLAENSPLTPAMIVLKLKSYLLEAQPSWKAKATSDAICIIQATSFPESSPDFSQPVSPQIKH